MNTHAELRQAFQEFQDGTFYQGPMTVLNLDIQLLAKDEKSAIKTKWKEEW